MVATGKEKKTNFAKLHSPGTEAQVCKQLAQSGYIVARRPEIESEALDHELDVLPTHQQ